MSFELTILGCSSASPTSHRNPSAQVLQHNEQLFLIDCGEGTQVQLRKRKIKFSKINHIFVSHLHGDHYFGLIGLLSTFHLTGRQNDLHIYAPAKLKEIIDLQFKASGTWLEYKLHFHAHDFENPGIIFEDDKLTVETIRLKHRIPTSGFVFREKSRPRSINRKMIDAFEVPVYELNKIKQGADYIDEEGKIVPNRKLTFDPPAPVSYAYCSDTMFYEPVISNVKGVDCLYHEATFKEDMRERAVKSFHSTTIDAATIAKKASVGQLIIGHYSARYNDLQELLEEAQTVFKQTALGEEGKSYLIEKTQE